MMDPVVVVGLDFGTTYSGFAFAHRSDPSDVQIVEDWPGWDDAGGKLYCKTQTSLFYVPTGRTGSFELKAWGWPALLAFMESLQGSYYSGNVEQDDFVQAITVVGQNRGVFATKFKLLLASDSEEHELPAGLSAQRLVSDYLRCMSEFIMDNLKGRYGERHFKKRDVLWCITVPAIWDDGAKQQMQVCCEMAGMVKGKYCTDRYASSHDLQIVLEPEAASMYCQKKCPQLSLQVGNEFMVVDIGGGTIDLVVHRKTSRSLCKVHEAASNCGEMGGGTFVDANFFHYLAEKIGCFQQFLAEDPKCFTKVLSWWLAKKCPFDGSSTFIGMGWDVPRKLSSAWRIYDRVNGVIRPETEYEELELSAQVYRTLFDTEVEKTIRLIRQKLTLCPRVKCLFLVGGFSGNPYMVNRIREEFAHEFGRDNIVVPVNPGAAVLHGAVRLGFEPRLVLSRISKKTYGLATSHEFHGCHSLDRVKFDRDGVQRCSNIFAKYIEKNQSVLTDSCVKHKFHPIFADQTELDVSLFSSDEECPIYTTDASCAEECSYAIDISAGLHLGTKRSIEVKMYFGRSRIEVVARRVNFGNPMPEKLYSVGFDTTHSDFS